MRSSNVRSVFGLSLVGAAISAVVSGCSAADQRDDSGNSPLPDMNVIGRTGQGLSFPVNQPNTTQRWSWISGDPAHFGLPMMCMDGSTTGFGINIPANWNHKVLIFEDGGGLCYDATTCDNTGNLLANVVPHANISAYGQNEFNNDVGYDTNNTSAIVNVPFPNTGDANWDPNNPSKSLTFNWTKPYLQRGIFDRTSPTNPFYNWAFVFIPYCTGDLHIGYKYDCDPKKDSTCSNVPLAGRTPSQKYPWKVGLWDAWYTFSQVITSPSLPGITQIVLTGGSAGGLGVIYNYRYLRSNTPSNVPITVISDAGAPLWTGTPASGTTQWSGTGGRQGYFMRQKLDGSQLNPPRAAGVPSYIEDLWADSWNIGFASAIPAYHPASTVTESDGKDRVLGDIYPIQNIWTWNATNFPGDKFGLINGDDDYAYSWLLPLNGPNLGIAPYDKPEGTDGVFPSVHFGLVDFVLSAVINHGNTSAWIVNSGSRPPASSACTPNNDCQALRPLNQNHTFTLSDTSLWGSLSIVAGGGNGLLDYFRNLGLTRN